MAEETTKFDPKLEEGIAYFEKMLQLTPDDRVTLQFLCVAYGQIGEPDNQRRAFVSLAGEFALDGVKFAYRVPAHSDTTARILSRWREKC